MALTETYSSTAGAGAHDGSSEANAWTFAEMIAAAPAAGTRVNHKGNVSQGAATLPSGTAPLPLVIRAYNSTIGDLDNLGRNTDGTIKTTNFPVLTVTGTIVLGAFQVLQNFDVTGALSTHLLGGTANDSWTIVRCKITNTQNNAAARTVVGDNDCSIVGSDLYCSGAAHASVIDMDSRSILHDTRLRGTSSSTLATLDNFSIIQRCLFWGHASSVGVAHSDALGAAAPVSQLVHNTFYGIDTGVTTPNSTPVGKLRLFANHITDCSKWIDNLHAATAAITLEELYTRSRDVTTLHTGCEHAVNIGGVTTDNGGAETDFLDAANGNFNLSPTAAGRKIVGNLDAGAYQSVVRGGRYQLGIV